MTSTIARQLLIHLSNTFFLVLISLIASCSQDTILNKDVIKNKKVLTMYNHSLPNIIDFFSKNYPYSSTQLENYFHSRLSLKKGYKDEYLLTENKAIKQIDLRGKDDEQEQLLIIDFAEPFCFNSDEFLKITHNKYTFVPDPRSPSFARVLDYKNNMGTVHLGYKPDDQQSDICIDSVVFNTIDTFQKT